MPPAKEHDHEQDDDQEHSHGGAAFERTEVDDAVLRELDAAHPVLSEILSLTKRYSELSDEERADAAKLHERMQEEGPWIVGFHAEDDSCAVCGSPVPALFVDRFEGGAALPYGSFASDLPVHVQCAPAFPEKYPRLAPRVLDQARRATMRDLDRPTAQMATFFRHDLIQHREFALDDWGNSVYEANEGSMTRALEKDIQKLIDWTHERLFHGHGHHH